MNIALTGASGFVGRHVLRGLLERGHAVRAIVRSARTETPTRIRLTWVQGALGAVTARQLEGCDVLIHLAAHGVVQGHDDWQTCIQVNVLESMTLLRQATAVGIRRQIVVGSCFEYGRSAEAYERIPVTAPLLPVGAYASSKAAASVAAIGWAHERGLDLTVARPFHVFGEGEAPQRLWPALRRAALAGEDFPMTFGEQVRDFCAVEEMAAQLVALAVTPGVAGPTVAVRNLGSGKEQTVRAFAEHWWRAWGARGRLQVGALPYRPGEVMRYVPML